MPPRDPSRHLWPAALLGWLGPVATMTALGALIEEPDPYALEVRIAMDATLLVSAAAFLSGSWVFVRRFRASSRSLGFLAAGALHGLGVVGLLMLALAGFHTRSSYPVDSEGWKLLSRRPSSGRLPFSGGLLPVRLERHWLWHRIDSGWGYIDESGEEAIPPRFDLAFPFHGGLAAAGEGGRFGYIDPRGAWVIPPRFEEARTFLEGRAAVRLGGRWGFVDREGRLAIEPRFEEAGFFSEGLAPVRLEGLWGFVDGAGSLAIAPRFDGARSFSEELAAVEVGGRWGFVDRTGRVAIDPRFDDGREFQEGRAAVEVDGRWGFVDREGRVRIEPRFIRAGSFRDGRAEVEAEEGWLVLDPDGKELSRFELPKEL